ncbi:MAG: YihY/virulence factor BrkB family protein [Planctomycetaceae bacterium]|nr:MAG: YihY/virulence factor BrkB family protein [Planctomycetaceae bacterium]
MKWLVQLSWKDIAKDLARQISEDDVFNGAAALGFYLTLAVFPGLIFLLSLLPYLPIPHLDDAIMDVLARTLPQEAADLLEETVRRIVSAKQGRLLSFSFLGMLWVASTGMIAVMQQLNNTNNVPEARPFLKARATAILLTLLFGSLVIGLFTLVIMGGFLEGWIAQFVGPRPAMLYLFTFLRWGLVLSTLLLGFALIYYLAPNVDQPLRLLTPGSVFAVVVLLMASQGFRVYIEHFADYEATYGAIGAVIVLMLWFYLAGLVLLIGSEINVVFDQHRLAAHPETGARSESSHRKSAVP